MLINSIKISGNKLLGNTVEITLNPRYNHIDCDPVSLKVVSNALGSFFHPKTALHPQIWNKDEFETGGYIEIKARNQPKKLMGFQDTATLTLVRKINKAQILITDDQIRTHQFTVQQFLDCVSCSGICVPTVFQANVENIVNWIDGDMIQNWAKLSYADLWNRIYDDVLCNERYDVIQDWMFRTRREEANEASRFMLERDQMVQKIQNYQEIVRNAEHFSMLYKRAESLKAIIETSETQKYLEEKGRLETQKQRLQEEIFELEKEEVRKVLLEDKNEDLMETLNQLEQLSLAFENESFDDVEPLSDDTSYSTFLQKLRSTIISYHETLSQYQNISKKCMNTERDILNYNFLFENEQSKITAINLFEMDGPTDLETYVNSFDSLLTSFQETLTCCEQDVIRSSQQLDSFLKDDNPEQLIKDLKNTLTHITDTKKDMKSCVEAISACFAGLRVMKTEKIILEENIQEAKSFICVSSDIQFAYIESLVAFEALLVDLQAEKSPLYDRFVCLLVRELTWKDISDNPFTLECISTFLMIVVNDAKAVQGFLARLPGTTLNFISLKQFRKRLKENLPTIRRAHHREILTVDQLVSSKSTKSLVKEVYRHVLLVSNSSSEEQLDARVAKRTLYETDNTFETNKGMCGGGHVLEVASNVQQNILKFLDCSKELRTVKEKIEESENQLIGLKEKLNNAIYDTSIFVNLNGKSFKEHIDLIDFDFKCLRDKNIQEIKVETIKLLIAWFKNNPEPLSATKEDSYARKNELKQQIANLELEYEKMLDEKMKMNQKLMGVVYAIVKLEQELLHEYDSGRRQLIEIDKDFNEEIRNGLTFITKLIEQCGVHIQTKLLQVQDQHAKNLHELTSKETTEKLYKKRLPLLEIATKISTIASMLKTTENPAVTQRQKQQLLLEFPTRDAQITELTNLQQELQNFQEYTSPSQINLKIFLFKSGIHKFKELLSAMAHWPSGFLENVFIMQNKASSHAISCIMAYVTTLSTKILPKDVSLHMWVVTESPNVEETLDLMAVREIRYTIEDPIPSNKIHLSKDLIMLLIIKGICCTFQAPFIILDNVFGTFDRQYWDMISTVLKILSEKRQIIMIKAISNDKTWPESGKPDKVVHVTTVTTQTMESRDRQRQRKTNIESSMDQVELAIDLQRSLQSLSLMSLT